MKADELLYNNITTVFKSAGIAPTPRQMEGLRVSCTLLAISLEKMSRAVVSEQLKKLQDVIETAFKSYEEDIEKLNKEIKELKKK